MKKLFKFLRNIIFLNIFLVIGVITLYANNQDFKLWMNDTVDKYINTKPPPVESIAYEPVIYESEIEVLSQVQQDYTEPYVIVQVPEYIIQEEDIEIVYLPEDNIDIQDEIYGEEVYETEIYIPPEETYEELSEEIITIKQSIIEEPIKSTTNIWDIIPKDRIDMAMEVINNTPDGDKEMLSNDQLAAIQNAPWAEVGFSSSQEAWIAFWYTQSAVSYVHGGEDFARWCTDIVNGVGSPYDNYGGYDPTAHFGLTGN